jgi:pimeloyl-ACP methyl ester carboxylesterase
MSTRSRTIRVIIAGVALAGAALWTRRAAPEADATAPRKAGAGPSITRTLGAVEFTPCSLSGGLAPQGTDAHCAKLSVLEDRSAPSGRRIELAIALVPASRDALPDPVVMIAGGPGQSALESYPQLAGAFAEVRKNHNVILVDQRGTGGSNRLRCVEQTDGGVSPPDRDDLELALKELRARTEACAKELSARADPRFYATSEAIDDLDEVRAALGVEQLNLMGISYGTRVAQQYAKRYPAHTRTVTLDGVVPNTLVLGNDHAKNLERSLDAQFALCANDPKCLARLGNPRARLDALLTLLKTKRPLVRYRDAVTGESKEEVLERHHVTTLARMFSYAPFAAGLLPLVLDEAAQGRYEPLLALSNLITAGFSESLSNGMELSVICAEDARGLKEDPADAQTLLGNELIRAVHTQCEVWPHGEAPLDARAPLTGAVPVLLLSGELDPVTPPKYGDEVAKALPNAKHLVVRGQGHNVLPTGCVPRLFSQFIDSANALTLEASCLDAVATAKPFIEFYGWDP